MEVKNVAEGQAQLRDGRRRHWFWDVDEVFSLRPEGEGQAQRFTPSTNPGLSPWAKLVRLNLAYHANARGTCFPGVSTIAEECCISIRQVQRSLRELEDKKWLNIARRVHPKTGSNLSSLYTLLDPPDAPSSDSEEPEHSLGVVSVSHHPPVSQSP